jgi:hypothetical protein
VKRIVAAQRDELPVPDDLVAVFMAAGLRQAT